MNVNIPYLKTHFFFKDVEQLSILISGFIDGNQRLQAARQHVDFCHGFRSSGPSLLMAEIWLTTWDV